MADGYIDFSPVIRAIVEERFKELIDGMYEALERRRRSN